MLYQRRIGLIASVTVNYCWKTLAKLECFIMKNRDIVKLYLKFYQDKVKNDDEDD